MQRILAIACVITCLQCRDASATDIFVDNLIGSDLFDGRLVRPIDSGAGPVRTLHRAMQLARHGDQIILTRPGEIYYDSLSLTGSRNSGSKNHPFTLIGNGAIMSGLRAVPKQGWQPAGPELWKLTLTRKGFYRLLRDGQPLTEGRHELGVNPLDSLAAGEWAAWQGSVYFRADGERPATQDFSYSADQTGLSLYQVDNVRIVDLTFRDFRFDGVHAQNMCRGITLENVTCINNGRAGIAVSGTSHIDVVGGKVAGNGRHQVLISKLAGAELRDVTMDGEPTMVP